MFLLDVPYRKREQMQSLRLVASEKKSKTTVIVDMFASLARKTSVFILVYAQRLLTPVVKVGQGNNNIVKRYVSA